MTTLSEKVVEVIEANETYMGQVGMLVFQALKEKGYKVKRKDERTIEVTVNNMDFTVKVEP